MNRHRFPDRRYFERIASESHFRPEPLETAYRLADLLDRIVGEAGSELLIRGGTALNLIYLDLPRLSVDADLDYIGAADASEARRRRPDLIGQLAAMAERAGYRVNEERPSYAMSHLRLHYENAAGRPAFLKVDINFLDRVPVLTPRWATLRHPFGEDVNQQVEIQTFALSELVASKVVALFRRSVARDLFDVAMMASVAGVDTDEVRSLLVIRGASYPPPGPNEYDSNVVEAVTREAWRSEVMALARRPLPMDLHEARRRASDLLREVSRLPDKHREFLRALDDGEIRPERLDLPDPSRVLANPGLLWRLRVGAKALEER